MTLAPPPDPDRYSYIRMIAEQRPSLRQQFKDLAHGVLRKVLGLLGIGRGGN